jgi:hypothetical protein
MNTWKNILTLLWNGSLHSSMWFFELSGVFVSHGLIDQNLYFDMFNLSLVKLPYFLTLCSISTGVYSTSRSLLITLDTSPRSNLSNHFTASSAACCGVTRFFSGSWPSTAQSANVRLN